MFDLVVLGDCNPDLVLSGADVVPQFGQVEKLVEDAELTIGGSGGIMAAGAARLGLNTAMVGVVGDDLFGRFMVDALIARNVDTTGITVDSNARSGLTVVLARPDDRAILTFPGTISALSREHIDSAKRSHVRATPAFFVNGRIQDVSFGLQALRDAVEASLRKR